MKAAKFISLIASILYTLYWLFIFVTIFKLNGVYQDLDIDIPIYSRIVPHLIFVIIVGLNFGFFLYLQKQSSKGKEVKNALLFSLLLAIIPLFFQGIILFIGTVLPIYNVTSAF